MNILFYFDMQINPIRGGSERVAWLVSNYLKQRGHRIFYMARYPVKDKNSVESAFLPEDGNGKLNIDFINQFIEYNQIQVIINEAGFNNDIYLFSHKNISQEVKIISCLHFDVTGELDSFYQSFQYSFADLTLKAKLLKIRDILYLPYLKWHHTKERNERYRFMYNQSDKVVLLCDSFVDKYKKVARLNEMSKLTVILNPNTFEISNDTFEKQNSVIYVGRMNFSPKRIDRILKVWKILHKKNPDLTLYMVGDGSYKQQAEQYAYRYNLPNVVFTGFLDPELYYRSAKIILLTSLYEGTPMVIPEAMAYGTVPIVMHNFAGATIHIKDGYNGFLTPKSNIKEMAKKINFLISNENLRKQMAKNAGESIKSFNIDIIGKQWDKLLVELCDER